MSDTIDLVFHSEMSLRLDKYLAGINHPRLYSRSVVEKLFAAEKVLVNGKPVKKSYLLNPEDCIRIELPALQPSHLEPQQIPLEIVFEDEFLAVINKPPALVVHPGHGNRSNTLANAIAYRYSDTLRPTEQNNRPGIVHRLDKGTSGLIVVARNEAVQAKLAELFARRQVKKTYLAVTVGIPEPAADTIETYISRSSGNPRKMAVHSSGKLARTSYEIIRYYQGFALLSINLSTGRMHQIRVHLADRNTPVLGDNLYGSEADVLNRVPANLRRKLSELLAHHLQRQALHAWKLQFIHPVVGAQHLSASYVRKGA